jgi:hypothetical protein
VLPVPPVSAQRFHCLILSSPFRTPPLATGSDVAQPHMSAAAPMSLAPRCLPYSQRARRVRVACSARRCPSDPEPPRSCRGGPCCTAPHPSSPLLLLPPRGTEPDPPSPFSSLLAPLSHHKKASPHAVPHFTCFPLTCVGAPRLLPHFLPLDTPVHRR